MVRIGATIVSLDVLEKSFHCDLKRCFGNCCRYGDSGAPLTFDEANELKRIYPEVEGFITKEGREAIRINGTSVVDIEGERVTPLIGGNECAYTYRIENIYFCGIEKAWNEGKVKFRKPISCHLFPVRVKELSGFISVNYEDIKICEAGRKRGVEEGVPVYVFLKDALVRRFGMPWYKELLHVAKEWQKHKGSS